MKKFLFYIFGFTFVIILLFSLITFITDKGLKKSEYGNLKEWSDIFNKNIHADIVIQGSSRAWVQFNTYILDSVLNADAYNMGMDGTPFDVQYVKYKSYTENNKYPEVILQNVDWDTMDKNTPVFQKYQLLPYLNNHYFDEQLLNNKIIPDKDVYLSFLKYAGEPKAVQVGFSEYVGIRHYVSPKHKGFMSVEGNWNESDFEKRKNGGKIHWEKNPEVEKLFIEFLQDCQSKKIKVVLVFAPYYHGLNNIIIDMTGLKTYYRNIAIKYNVEFLDYSLDPVFHDKNYFYNASHLNKKGAEMFTLKLANKLKDMQIIKPANTNQPEKLKAK
ncbi:MAG: hypothetical protein WC542_15505 [Paludibacter sp.]